MDEVFGDENFVSLITVQKDNRINLLASTLGGISTLSFGMQET